MYISSWSGGKDSCLACYRFIQEGFELSSLVNLISDSHRRVRFHGTKAELISHQAELIGLPLLQKETSDADYEAGFKNAVSVFIPGIKGMIFGDIYINEHRQWVERVCGELGIEAIEPLWKEDTESLILEFLDSGFEAVIVSGQASSVDKEWMGQPLNKDFVKYLKTKPDADICGENGEYHTFVVSGPLFRGRIDIIEKEVINRNGYWFLDIKDFRVLNA